MHADHHVLRDVFGVGREPLSKDRHGQTERRPSIAPDELGEGGLVAAIAAALDQPLVGLPGVRTAVQRARSEART